jgi:hypothetical protein
MRYLLIGFATRAVLPSYIVTDQKAFTEAALPKEGYRVAVFAPVEFGA